MIEDRPDVIARLEEEIVTWLTTVSPRGQPQPSLVWYVVGDDAIVIYSKDDTPRLRNIRTNPRVAISLNSDADGADMTIIEGEAEIVGADVPPSGDPAYVAKYEQHLPRWGFTWDSYDEGYPVRIHVRPTRLRGHLSTT